MLDDEVDDDDDDVWAYLVSILDRQASPRQETVLHIDDKKCRFLAADLGADETRQHRDYQHPATTTTANVDDRRFHVQLHERGS